MHFEAIKYDMQNYTSDERFFSVRFHNCGGFS